MKLFFFSFYFIFIFLVTESSTSSPGGNQVDGLPPVSSEASLHAHEEQFRGSGVFAATEVPKNPMPGNTEND